MIFLITHVIKYLLHTWVSGDGQLKSNHTDRLADYVTLVPRVIKANCL